MHLRIYLSILPIIHLSIYMVCVYLSTCLQLLIDPSDLILTFYIFSILFSHLNSLHCFSHFTCSPLLSYLAMWTVLLIEMKNRKWSNRTPRPSLWCPSDHRAVVKVPGKCGWIWMGKVIQRTRATPSRYHTTAPLRTPRPTCSDPLILISLYGTPFRITAQAWY